jgi:hypothetical protein
MNEWRVWVPPAECTNWTKWSRNRYGSAVNIPTHPRIKCHNGATVGQDKNIWCTVSSPPQPVAQSWESGAIIWRRTKWSWVGSLLRSNHHAKTDTLRGTCLCKANPKVPQHPRHPSALANHTLLEHFNYHLDHAAIATNREHKAAKQC